MENNDNSYNEAVRLYTTLIHKQLIPHIKGKNKVYVSNDIIYITIEAPLQTYFTYSEQGITDLIYNGVPSTVVVHKGLNEYRKYILNKFFN